MSRLHGRSYRHRAFFLKKLGFASYQAYLASDLWREVREKVFALKGRRCHLCGEFASQAHHTRYLECDLTGRKTKHIHPICGKCHKEIEFTADGEKATVAQAKKAFSRKKKLFRKAAVLVLTGCFGSLLLREL